MNKAFSYLLFAFVISLSSSNSNNLNTKIEISHSGGTDECGCHN